MRCFLVFLGLVVAVSRAQLPPGATAAEVATKDAPATFTSKVSLVLVPVVVRDRDRKTVGTLKQEDFQLYDKGKLQVITKFSIEKASSRLLPVAPKPEPADP